MATDSKLMDMDLAEAKVCQSLLMRCMEWQATPQGHEFWQNVYDRLGDNIEMVERRTTPGKEVKP